VTDRGTLRSLERSGPKVRPMADDQSSNRKDVPEPRIELPAEKARGAEIVLRTRVMRIIFLGGLAAFVVIVAVLLFLNRR